jgi:hypothetical protein
MHLPVRIAAPLAAATLLAALFPAVASAATPVAAVGGSGLLLALAIAGAGAVVIVLIMVVLPSTRRAARSSGSASGSPTVSAFRAHPGNSSSTGNGTDAAASAPDAIPSAADLPVTAVTEPERPTALEPPSVLEPQSVPEPPSVLEPAAVDERAAVAVADPPLAAAAVTPGASSPPPPPSTQPVPDLLATFSPVAVLGESSDPEHLRVPVGDGTSGAIGPEIGARALLRDHSLAVPIAACVLLGVTVQLIRSRRRR